MNIVRVLKYTANTRHSNIKYCEVNCVFLSPECARPYKPKDINVFKEPLIDKLKKLFEEGILCYNTLAKETFKLRVVMLWTIHDSLGKFSFGHVHTV